jgi:acyl-CoA synthetase (AMP-forming)/AMP-acid ligase II
MRDDERLADTGEQGEIVVRGGGVKRYLDRAVTAAAQSTGWHRTGDIGYLDEDGYLYVVGRKKDVVNMAGFKIPAADVERVIMELPEVQECAVVAVPDPMRGEAIQAIITIKSGHEFSSRVVVKHCVERLGKGKAPHHVDVWPELPRSSVGKIDKRHILQKVLDSQSRRAGVSS